MNVIDAIKKMKKGKKVKRKNWLKNDFLYIDEKTIKDDGGNIYHLAVFELLANNWETVIDKNLKTNKSKD